MVVCTAISILLYSIVHTSFVDLLFVSRREKKEAGSQCSELIKLIEVFNSLSVTIAEACFDSFYC